MSQPAEALEIAREHLEALEAIAVAGDDEQRSVRLARALLLASRGLSNAFIADELGISPTTVRAWRARFEAEGLNVLSGVRPGRGRNRIPDEKVEEILHATVHEDPPNGGRWTCRSMASATGVSASTVQRLWTAYGVDPALGPPLQLSR